MTDEANGSGDGSVSGTVSRSAPSATGDAQVDRILALLDGMDDLAVAEHAEVYSDVLGRLGHELNPEQRLRQAGAHGAS